MPEKKEKDQELRRILQSLEERDIVIVPTEKTNRFRMMKKEEYKTTLKENPQAISKRYREGNGTEIFEDSKVLVDAIGFKTSKNEVGHINELP